jgi:outer membrane protein assembly factor BamB
MKLQAFACSFLVVFVASIASAQQSPSLLNAVRSGAGSNIDWAQFNFDSTHDGYNPFETILSPANVGNVARRWSYVASEGDVQGPPVVVNDKIYFGVENTFHTAFALYALDAANGDFLWKFPSLSGFDSPAVANGLIYATDYDVAQLYALDANSGALVWQSTDDECYGSPTVANDVVYIYCAYPDLSIIAMNAHTGAVIWRNHTNATANPSPAVANGVVYASDQSGAVYAVNASTGSTIWVRQLGIGPTPLPTPYISYGGLSVANGIVYVEAANPGGRPPTNYNVWALSAGTGATVWKSSAVGSINHRWGTTPSVANGMVYVGVGGDVRALSAATGAAIWSYQPNADDAGSPIVANGVVYVGSLLFLGEGTSSYAISALDSHTGTLLWNYTGGVFNFERVPTPAVVNGMIYGSINTPVDGIGAFGLPNE